MKLIIPRLDLLNLMSKIQAVVPAKPALPILSNILIEAIGGQLILSATDLTVSVRAFSLANIEQEGSIALPAKKFFQLVRELTAPQIKIETSSSEIAYIYAGTSEFKISGMHQSEFPTLPDFSEGIGLTIDNSLLKDFLSRSAFAAARDDNRQVLNGILFQYQEKMATFTGTDGKRLARIFAELELNRETGNRYILPLKAVEEMIKLLDPKEPQSKLIFISDKVALETGNVILMTKLLSGQYPDVDRVIPKKALNPIALHREELMSLLRQMSLFTTDHSSAVRFTFTPGELLLTAMSGQFGEGKVSMLVNYEGPKLDIAFNPLYFLDILRHSKDELVQLSVSDAYSPGLITDSTKADFVLMPMRLETVPT